MMVKIGESIVAKIATGDPDVEVSNMEYVRKSCRGMVKMPRAYRSFMKGSQGYIFMDWI